MSNIPLTIQSVAWNNWHSTIVFNNHKLVPGASGGNLYWFIVVNRLDLSIAANFTATDNSSIPGQLQPYLGNTDYIMIVTTQKMASSNLPQGKLYDLLIEEGADVGLKSLEQIYEALGCGNWGWMSYTMVCVLGSDGFGAFEQANYLNAGVVLTMELCPVDISGQTYYTPCQLS